MRAEPLITKVLLPRRREDVFTRQRLIDQLYDLIDRRLVLVAAPAGYGKTTLLIDFARDLEHPVCWYTLDRSDHDPHVFFEHLILSIRQRFPNFGDVTSQALSASRDLADGAPTVVNAMLNEIVDVIPRWFVLVLDDYHQLGQAPQVSQILGRLASYQTDQFLIIISSRTVPELPVTIQLTARGQMVGLGQHELRFRADEIQQLLAQNYAIHMPHADAAELAAQSEGWITGILLTAHTMWRGILDGLARARSSAEQVYDYLAQEVFAGQEPETRDFLTASSTLSEMSPVLCETALGLPRAAHFLALVEERNLFVVRLEDEWYRYHHLFRDYLQTRLRCDDPARWTDLHRRAAAWFEVNHRPEEAIDHYLTAGEHADAARVMAAVAQTVFYAGRVQTLADWIAALPSDLREQFPRLLLFESRAAEMLGHWEHALALTEAAERGCRAAGLSRDLAYVLLHRAQLWHARGRYHGALTLARQALALIDETGVPVTYEAHRILGMAALALGQLEDAQHHLQQALNWSRQQAGTYEQTSIQDLIGDCLWRRGRWSEAIAIQRETVEAWRQMENPGALSGALNDLGFYLYSCGEYREALDLFRQALALARQSGHRRHEALTLLSLAELKRDLGALDEALDTCHQSVAVADALGDEFLSAYGRETLGLIHRGRGNLDAARAAVEEALERARRQTSDYQLGRYRASLGLIRAEAGDVEAGLGDITQACTALERIGALTEIARAHLFAAWVLYRAGRTESALVSLQAALAAAPHSRTSLFVVEGRHMLPLLKLAVERAGDGDEIAGLVGQAEAFDAIARDALSTEPPPPQATEPLRIYAFGRGRVERDGVEIPLAEWGAAATRYLLFYLLIHPSRSRDDIAAVLWPELPANKVKANFHTTKFRLKRALGCDPLYFDGQLYSIHPDLDHWFDVAEFERLLEASGTAQQRIDRLRRAVDLVQGDLLDDCYADWCMLQREALREKHLSAIDELATRLIVRRQYREAIDVLRRGLQVDNLRENLHRQLMRALALSGLRSQAVTQYRSCAETLAHELGVAPDPDTEALHQRILSGHSLDAT